MKVFKSQIFIAKKNYILLKIDCNIYTGFK